MSTTNDQAVAAHPPAPLPAPAQPASDPAAPAAELTALDRPTEAGPALRASDAERTATADRLHEALGAGRLDLAETDERVAAAYAARYRHELPALLADLPDAETTSGRPPTWAGLWALAVWRVRAVVLADARGAAHPTPPQLRTAAVLTVLAAGWFVLCALLGALVVAA